MSEIDRLRAMEHRLRAAEELARSVRDKSHTVWDPLAVANLVSFALDGIVRTIDGDEGHRRGAALLSGMGTPIGINVCSSSLGSEPESK